MAKGKYTYDDMLELVKEIERGAKDKSRTLNSVTNPTVKAMLAAEASMALKAGVTKKILLGEAVVTTALMGSIGTASSGTVATGVTALGVHALTGTAAATTTSYFLATLVPVIGIIVILVTFFRIKKNAEKKESLHQAVEQKQNTVIRDLVRELDELKEVHRKSLLEKERYKNIAIKALEDNERYRYIISLLMANEELRKAV